MKTTAVTPHQTDSAQIYFTDIWFPDYKSSNNIDIIALSSSGTNQWLTWFTVPATSTSFWTANYLLSFGGTRNDLLAACTNEDPTNLN